MIPQAVPLTLPVWAQAILALAAVLANVGTFAFVIFVLWPSIRSQERRAQKLEDWTQTAEFEQVRRAVISRINKADGLDAAGKPADKNSWLEKETKDGDRSDL